MFSSVVECPICRSKNEFTIKNKKGEKAGSIGAEMTVIEKIDDNKYKCELTMRCNECRINFKSIEEIEIK